MKKYAKIKNLFYTTLILTFATTTNIANATSESISTPTNINKMSSIVIPPYPISINASSWVLMNYTTGNIISEHDMHKRRQAASLTKIMTAYIIASQLKNGSLKYDQKIKISDKAAKTGGSKMFIRANSKITVDNLLHGLLIQSGNDSAVALSQYVGGSQSGFVTIMNSVAQKLGLKNTRFSDVNGLPGGTQYTTAYDMALLTRAFIYNFPKVYKIASIRSFTWSGITQANRNGLLWSVKGVDGFKTGHTSQAGYNLIASAMRNNNRYISVVLGAASSNLREQGASQLLHYGYSNFANFMLAEQNKPIDLGVVNIKDASKSQKLVVYAKNDYIKTIPKVYSQNIQKKVKLDENIHAPIKKGQQVGYIFIFTGKKNIAKIPVFSSINISKIGFFERIIQWF